MSRVLFLLKGLARGGAERLLVDVTRHLDRSRFDCDVAYLLREKDDLVAELESGGVPVRCVGGGHAAAWPLRLRRLVAERAIDLVHAHSPYAAVGARLALGRAPVPLVYTEHALASSYHPLTYWANALTFPMNDHVFAVSDSVRASLRYPSLLRRLPMPRVETLYHGCDPAAVERWREAGASRAELGVPEGVPVVGTTAGFTPDKGHAHLVAAADRVRARIPDVRFVLVGSGPLEGDVRREVRRRGLERTVVFAGHRADAARLAGAFDIFVLPSLREGFGLALVEALALGTPVVATDSGGPAEVVEDGRSGVVVPAGDAVALAEAVVALLEDPAARAELADAARLRAARFDIRTAVRRAEAVYDELLG